MSDRLKELQRQRTLVQEQLAWLEREIAAGGGATPSQTPVPVASVITAVPGPDATTASVEAIMAKYQADAAAMPGKIKRGCFLYLLFALGLLFLGIFVLFLHTVRK